jgi:hypothetical protein
MHRILSPKYLFLGVAWLVLGLLLLRQAAPEIVRLHLRDSAIPVIGWLGINAVLWKPVWRWFWRKFPKLNLLVFPDLNGTWDVELCSNWPRQVQLLEAAASSDKSIDMRRCSESELAALEPLKLKAEITQTWWAFHMRMWNPAHDTPIKRSDTITVDPIARQGQTPPGICYFYKQENATDNVADDPEFYGAARLNYDIETGELEGLVWTARMWRRAINTAGVIRMTRARQTSFSTHLAL